MATNGSAPLKRAEPTETEWQFDALDLGAVERWLDSPISFWASQAGGISIGPGGLAHRLADTYFDSADWRIGRGGYVLRERHRRGRAESTLKSIAPAEEGLRRRVELTEQRRVEEFSPSDDGEVGRRVAALIGSAPLRMVVGVVTRRRPRVLSIDGREVGELALDETTISMPGMRRKLHLRRVELEINDDVVAAGRRLAEALRLGCALAPATLSKFEAGLLFGGLSIPGPPDLGAVEIDKSSTIGELALAAVRRDVRALLAREPGTRLGEDVEELHQIRVATRRLRAALAQFEGVLPVRAATLRGEIGWLAELLGGVRDLDVQIEQTDKWIADAEDSDRPYLEELSARLEAARVAARLILLEGFDSRRYARLVSALTSMLRTSTGRRNPAARTPAVIALPDLVSLRHRAVMKAVKRARRTGIPTDFHNLRIRVKRLRYALEFTGDLYGAESRRHVRALATLQGRLGSMQDAEVAADRLRDVALSQSDGEMPLSLAAVFTVGGLAARYRAESLALLERLAKEVDVCDGPTWRRLARSMEQERNLAIEARAPRVLRPSTEIRSLPVPAVGAAAEPIVEPAPLPETWPQLGTVAGPNRPFTRTPPPAT